MRTNKITYYTSTALLTALMLFSSGMYFFNHAAVESAFTALGFPTYLIYPLAALKLLGLIAIWTRRSNILSEWAYAGFFFNFVLALTAHLAVADGGHTFALMAIVFLITSYYTSKRLFG